MSFAPGRRRRTMGARGRVAGPREVEVTMGATKAEVEYRRAERALWEDAGLRPKERFIEAGPEGTRLRVTEVGDGPPVVFIGGTGGTGPYWAPLITRLRARAVILDRPGFGLSDPIDYGRHPYGALVTAMIEDVLDAAGLGTAAIVGASIGDVWAMTAAERLTDRVCAVALLGAGPLAEEVTPPPFIRLLRSPAGALIVRMPQRPSMLRRQLRQIGHGASLDAGRIPEVFLEWQKALMRRTPSMRHERRMVQAVLNSDGFISDLRFDTRRRATIKQPVLMIIGSEDPVGTVDVWSRFVSDLPDGTLRVLDGAGHIPWLDDPERVAGWLCEHLDTRA